MLQSFFVKNLLFNYFCSTITQDNLEMYFLSAIVKYQNLSLSEL
jgi:hypothetical protein